MNYDIAIGYENSAFFNDWCGRKIGQLLLYYPNIKLMPLKIKVYIDYLTKSSEDRSVLS
jgi:hypothetical protein